MIIVITKEEALKRFLNAQAVYYKNNPRCKGLPNEWTLVPVVNIITGGCKCVLFGAVV